jgi:hypothetical protein
MAPPTKKQKLYSTHRYLDLSNIADQHKDLATQLQSVLSEASIRLPAPVAALLSLVETSISQSEGGDVVEVDLQASKLGLPEVKDLTGIDYKLTHPDYIWSLKEIQSPTKPLSDWAGACWLTSTIMYLLMREQMWPLQNSYSPNTPKGSSLSH